MYHLKYDSLAISYLSDNEINNPFLVLNESFARVSSPDDVLEDLYEIWVCAMWNERWVKHKSPAHLYKIFKKIVRLMEAAWIINTFDSLHLFHDSYRQTERYAFQQYDQHHCRDCLHESQHLSHLLSENPLIDLKFALYDLTCLSLHSKQTREKINLDSFYFEAMQTVHYLIEIIFQLFKKFKNNFGGPFENRRYLKTLKKIERKNLLYRYHTKIEDFVKHRKIGESMEAIGLVEQANMQVGFWRIYRTPGDMLHYFHDFQFLIDYFSHHLTTIKCKRIAINTEWPLPERIINKIRNEGTIWMLTPWQYLDDQFAAKSRNDWQVLLERFLIETLSNKVRIRQTFNNTNDQLLVFLKNLTKLEAIVQYAPKSET